MCKSKILKLRSVIISLLGILLILRQRLEFICKSNVPNIYFVFFSAGGLHSWVCLIFKFFLSFEIFTMM